jgi:hypothetical protein
MKFPPPMYMPMWLIAASAGGLQEGLFESPDGGETWQRVRKAVGLLAWPKPDLYIVVTGGQVFRSRDAGAVSNTAVRSAGNRQRSSPSARTSSMRLSMTARSNVLATAE